MTVDYANLRKDFEARFGRAPRIFRAPGRVNLIGEHTDYNGGFVLPMAIESECAIAAAPRADRKILAHSINLNETGEFDLDAEINLKKGAWMNFVEGMARILERQNYKISGADLLIYSTVPTGAGLSSSAALEIVSGLALSEISGQTVDRKTLALAGQQTEHEFVGAKVGIMDQFVSAHAREGHALLLDCRSLEFENVPLDTRDAAIVICDTRVKHDLATSEYNTRRAECERGVEILQKFLPGIAQLRDVSVEAFEKFAAHLPDVIRRRCRHVVTENERTLQAAERLRKNDLAGFGSLMRESHRSLRDDYEVSSRELDYMVEIAAACEGVFGARMTGGGFGGSTVNLVRRGDLKKFSEKITIEYERRFKLKPTIYISGAADGASEIFDADSGS
jgi:galactokinase